MQDKVIQYIKDHPGGVLQNQLGKELGLDSKKCSKLVKRLVELGQVQRQWEKVGAVRTYRIVLAGEKRKSKPKPKCKKDSELSKLVLAGGEVVPCLGCRKYPEDCKPNQCPQLDGWVMLLGSEG